jgi:hypothetical protein
MLATVVIAVLIIGAVAFVAYPFFVQTRTDEMLAQSSDPLFENLIVQRDATYSAIRELETDHAMSKLSDADYKSLRAKYETKAVSILQELDGYRIPQDSDDDDTIEAQVKAMRGTSQRKQCVKCNTRAQSNDRFCAKCGAPLKA